MKSRLCFTLMLFLFLLGGCDAVGENPAPHESGEEYHALQMDSHLPEVEPLPRPGGDTDTLGWGGN